MSLFGKKSKNISCAGLDIGSRSLKLVEIKNIDGEYHLMAMGLKELRPGIVEDGDIKDKEAFIEAIRALVDRCDTNIVDIVISLGGQGVLSDTATFKIEPHEDISDTIFMEATGRTPFDAEDITLSYKILSEDPEKNEVNVLLVAAKNPVMQNYIDALYDAHLRPTIVDVDTFAFNNCYAQEGYVESDMATLVLIDIGYTSSRLLFVKDGIYHSAREISIGAEFFIKTFSKMLKIEEAESEMLLHGRTVDNVSETEFENTLQYALDELGASINMAIQHYSSESGTADVDKVVLSGGGAYIPKLESYLSEHLSTNVAMSNPFSFLKYDPEMFGGADVTTIASRLSVAVGLALRKVD